MPVDSGGCGWYRVRQPLAKVKLHTEHDTHVVDTKDEDYVAVTKALSVADIAIVRQGGEEGMRQMRQIPEFAHLKWVIDIDDNIELISPYSEHYSEYGMAEFTHNGVKVWEDGVNIDLAANRGRINSLLQGMRDADLVTVTTEELAGYARKYNKNVAVLPNLIDTDTWWRLPLKPSKTLKIGWSGGVSHYEDLYTIKEPLNDVLRRFDVELYMVGAHFSGLIDEDNRGKVRVLPWVPFQAHSYRMMCLGLDVAIVPLADLPFNRYKSPIKFLEFAAAGIPTLVANVTPYKQEIEHEKTAIAYTTAAEFKTGLLALLYDARLRERIGRQAREHVLEHRDAAKNAHRWTEAYGRLLT